MKPFEFFEHTADIGIFVYGKSLKQLFSNGGYALFDFIGNKVSDKRVIKKNINIELDCFDREELFIRWLSELLYIYEAQGIFSVGFDIDYIKKGRMKAMIIGEKYDPLRHAIKNIVKAVTYHNFTITKEKAVWKARVILDV